MDVRSAYFTCNDGVQIGRHTLCDDFPDCPEGEDEFPFIKCAPYNNIIGGGNIKTHYDFFTTSKASNNPADKGVAGETYSHITGPVIISAVIIGVFLLIIVLAVRHLRSVELRRFMQSSHVKPKTVKLIINNDDEKETASPERFALRDNMKLLTRSLHINADLLSALIEYGVITTDMMEEIQSIPVQAEMALKLVHMIDRRGGQEGFSGFVKALREQNVQHGDIADVLMQSYSQVADQHYSECETCLRQTSSKPNKSPAKNDVLL